MKYFMDADCAARLARKRSVRTHRDELEMVYQRIWDAAKAGMLNVCFHQTVLLKETQNMILARGYRIQSVPGKTAFNYCVSWDHIKC